MFSTVLVSKNKEKGKGELIVIYRLMVVLLFESRALNFHLHYSANASEGFWSVQNIIKSVPMMETCIKMIFISSFVQEKSPSSN